MNPRIKVDYQKICKWTVRIFQKFFCTLISIPKFFQNNQSDEIHRQIWTYSRWFFDRFWQDITFRGRKLKFLILFQRKLSEIIKIVNDFFGISNPDRDISRVFVWFHLSFQVKIGFETETEIEIAIATKTETEFETVFKTKTKPILWD